jgi:hypothetical protein
MTDSLARLRRCLALGLLALLPASLAPGQARPAVPGALGRGADAQAPSSLMAVHDGNGLVTVVADQASVREVFRVLSRWFDFPALNIDTIPDVRVPVRFERMPVTQVVQRLLRVAGLPSAPITPRARPASASRAAVPLIIVHDGHGAVTVMGEQASTGEVLSILSRWFGFPIINPEAIPNTRGAMRFERVQIAQLVDRLLRGVSLNYVILTNPQTSIPSKVVAAPLSASISGTQAPAHVPANTGPTTVGMPGSGAMMYPPVANGMPMPVPMPVDPAMPMLPMDPMPGGQAPYPQGPPSMPPYQVVQPAPPTSGTPTGTTPGATPGATRPGQMTPAAPAKPPG